MKTLASIGVQIRLAPWDDIYVKMSEQDAGEYIYDPTPFEFLVEGRLEDGQIFYGLYGPVISGPDRYHNLICNIFLRTDAADWRISSICSAFFKVGPSKATRCHQHDFRHPEGTAVSGFPLLCRFGEICVVSTGGNPLMTEQEWLACDDPRNMLQLLKGTISDRRRRLFAVACCQKVWNRMIDERSRNAVTVAERFADGNAAPEELAAARDDAGEVRFADGLDGFEVAQAARTVSALDDTVYAGWDAATAGFAIQDVLLRTGVANADGARKEQGVILRDIFGNPFRPVTVSPAWQTATVLSLAQRIYDDRAFDRLPILADALEDAGCTNADILGHSRGLGPHVLGCWVVDLLLGKT